MRVLVVNAHAGRGPAEESIGALRAAGHTVRTIDLEAERFAPFMTTAERRAYHSDEPVVAEEVRRSVDAVRAVEAMLFVYPTTARYVPARLKGWLDRVLVPGVAFVFDDAGRVSPGMTHISRLGAVTDLRGRPRSDGAPGYRTLLRTLRLVCDRRCRLTWVTDPTKAPSALQRW